MSKYFKTLTVVRHSFDYDQMQRLNKRLEVDVVKADGGWKDKSEKNQSQRLTDMWIQEGARLNGIGMEKALEALDFAYNKLLPLEEE